MSFIFRRRFLGFVPLPLAPQVLEELRLRGWVYILTHQHTTSGFEGFNSTARKGTLTKTAYRLKHG